MAEFRIVGPEKFPPGRNIEKQIAHRNLGPFVPGDRLDRAHNAPLNLDFGSGNRIGSEERVLSVSRDIEAMDGSASPLKPKVAIDPRSSAV